MQISLQYILIVSLLSIVYGQFEKKDVRSIASGTSFGMCAGYCRQSINVTSDPLQIVASKEANFNQETYPSTIQQFPLSTNQWEQLVSLLNLETFTALPDSIGCPDCADGGAEWIQVNWEDAFKHVTFDYGSTINGIQELIEKLRQMRQEYLAQPEH